MCRRWVVDHAAAEDLTQELFLEVWRKAARSDPANGTVVGGVLTIARDRSIDRIRATASIRRRDTDCSDDPRRTVASDVDRRTMHIADAQRIRAALDRLSDRRREALVYAFCTDHSYRQASDLLGIPHGTFTNRVRDASLILSSHLDDAA